MKDRRIAINAMKAFGLMKQMEIVRIFAFFYCTEAEKYYIYIFLLLIFITLKVEKLNLFVKYENKGTFSEGSQTVDF